MREDELRAWAEQFERQLADSFTRLGRIFEEGAAQARMRWQAAAGSHDAGGGATAGQGDPVETLRRLKQLQAEGLITEAEYEAKKREVLARL